MTRKKQAGFTLVELIVVLTILVVLAAILIPVINGYSEDAKAAAAVADARTMLGVAKAVAMQEYASNPNYASGSTKFTNKATGKKVGRVTNFMFYTVQVNGKRPNTIGAEQSVDCAVAYGILENMGCLKKNASRINFSSSTWPANGIAIDDYYRTYKQPGIIIVYTPEGDIECLEFGMNGYLVHMNSDGTYTVTKNGKFTKNYPDR